MVFGSFARLLRISSAVAISSAAEKSTLAKMTSFYSLNAVRSDGSNQAMDDFRGKVVYATNVASKWGLTNSEYAQMEKLGKRWGDQLVIMAFPSREYMWQEYSTDEEIQEFAKSKKFPGILMQLGSVKGDTAPEVWKHMRDITGSGDPSWNFKGKYLVSRTGEISVPTDLEADIAKLIEESPVCEN